MFPDNRFSEPSTEMLGREARAMLRAKSAMDLQAAFQLYGNSRPDFSKQPVGNAFALIRRTPNPLSGSMVVCGTIARKVHRGRDQLS
mmetsp:Transcript_16739/g.28254  ORF Transcript_16739/g.28254 Transcript_16739/m.28254 type:complete len:87 (-) Transcript_16739:133-393(-)